MSHDYNMIALTGFWLYWAPVSIAMILFAGWMRQPDA